MDGDWNSTYTIEILSSIFTNDSSAIIWDNSTNGLVPFVFQDRQHQYFLIGMSFVGGLVVGIILHFLYVCLQRFVLTQMMEEEDMYHPSGVTNLSFIGDDHSRLDPPPDYATVVSGNNCTSSSNQKRTPSLLERIFRRSSPTDVADCGAEDQPPPSYSDLEVDFCVRWQSDDRIDIFLTERLPGQDR